MFVCLWIDSVISNKRAETIAKVLVEHVMEQHLLLRPIDTQLAVRQIL